LRTSILVVLALAVVRPAAALDVKLWPFFRYARDDDRGLMHWSAFGPLIEYTSTPERRDLWVRPVLGLHQRRGTARDDRADIFYPLASSRWRDDYQSFRFLLFTYRTSPPPGSEDERGRPPPLERWASRLTVLPFVFYRHTADGATSFSLFPLWLDADDFLGYVHVRAVLFPAYLRLTEPDAERSFYAFPFVSTVGGPLGHGLRIWPVWGDGEVAGRWHTRYILWPFAVWDDRMIPGWGWERRRIYFPAYAAIDGAARTSRGYGVVGYLHTVDMRHGHETIASPWPVRVRERALGASEYRTWRLFPFYGRSENRDVASRFWVWPAYRTKSQDVDDFHYRRRDVGLVLWRRQMLDSDASGHHEQLLTLFPLVRSASDDGRAFGQTPALADSLLPKNRGVLDLWAPIYGLYRWDTRPDGAHDWNLAWGLVAREDGVLRGPWHLDLAPDAASAHGD
jgi:hypothetical protein